MCSQNCIQNALSLVAEWLNFNGRDQRFLTGGKFTPWGSILPTKGVIFLKYKLKQTSVFSI